MGPRFVYINETFKNQGGTGGAPLSGGHRGGPKRRGPGGPQNPWGPVGPQRHFPWGPGGAPPAWLACDCICVCSGSPTFLSFRGQQPWGCHLGVFSSFSIALAAGQMGGYYSRAWHSVQMCPEVEGGGDADIRVAHFLHEGRGVGCRDLGFRFHSGSLQQLEQPPRAALSSLSSLLERP